MQLHVIASIGYDATAVVHVSVIMLQPPQPHVHFCQFINYYWLPIPYILISSVRENRSKPVLYNGANPVLIEHGGAKQQRDKVKWFSGSFLVSI